MDVAEDAAAFMGVLHEEDRIPPDALNQQDYMLDLAIEQGLVNFPTKPAANPWSQSITRKTIIKFYGGYPINKAGDRTGIHQRIWRNLIECYSFSKLLRDYHRLLASWQLVPRIWKDMDYALIPKTKPDEMTFTICKARPIGLMHMMRRCHEYSQVIHLRQVQRHDWTLHQLQPQFSAITVDPASLPHRLQGKALAQNALAASIPPNQRPTSLREVKNVLLHAGTIDIPPRVPTWATMPVNQHAFRQQWSALAQETLMHEILATHSNSRLLLLDLTSAFNKVLLDKLLMTLNKKGFPSYMVNGIASLFMGTVVRVRFANGSRSRPVHCGVGVPQGGAMGPILFNHSCTDLPARLPLIYDVPLAKSAMFGQSPVNHQFHSLQAYADDNSVVALTRQAAVDGLRIIEQWCGENNMSLSKAKSSYLSRASSPPLMEVERKEQDKHLGFIVTSNGIDSVKHVNNRASTFNATVNAISFASHALPHWTRAVMVKVNALPALEWGLGLVGHATYFVGGARAQVLDTLSSSLSRAMQVVFQGNAGHDMTKLAMLNVPTAATMLSEWEARLTFHLRHRVSVYNPVIPVIKAALEVHGSHSASLTTSSRIVPHAVLHPLYSEWILDNQDKSLDARMELGEFLKTKRSGTWLSGGKSQPYLKTVLYLLPGEKKWGGLDSSLFIADSKARRHLILWRLGIPLELRCSSCNTHTKLDRGHVGDCRIVEHFMAKLPEDSQIQLEEWKQEDCLAMRRLVHDADLKRFSYLDVMLNHCPELAESFIKDLTSGVEVILQQPP
jgi:hypothetical protein